MVNIPNRVQDVLSSIRFEFPDAIIGGGYLRDLDNGVEPKDIDIFAPRKESDGNFELMKRCVQHLGFIGRDVTRGSEYAKGSPTLIFGVYEFTDDLGEPPPLNVIVTAPASAAGYMQDQLDRFDIGLCKIAFDGQRVIRRSEYLADKAGKRITIVNPWCAERSRDRAFRIQKRYPGWKVFHADGTELGQDAFEFTFDGE